VATTSWTAPIGAALAVLALTACGGEESREEPPVQPPLRYGGPDDAALRYIRRVGDSDVGLALAVYEPSVVRALGLARMARSVNFSRGRLGAVTARVRSTRRLRASRLGAVDMRVHVSRGRQPPDVMRFVAIPDGRRWRLVYDSFTRQALEAFARLRAEERPGRYGDRLEEAGETAAGLGGRDFDS